MLTKPATNLIPAIRRGANPNSFQKQLHLRNAAPRGGQGKGIQSQPTRSDVTTTTAKLIAAKQTIRRPLERKQRA